MTKVRKNTIYSRESILNDLEKLYGEALARENLSVALKIKELQAKELGLFCAQKNVSIDLKSLTDKELENIITQLEKDAL